MEVQHQNLKAENDALRAANHELRQQQHELRDELHKTLEQVFSLEHKTVIMPKMARSFALLSETVKGKLLNQLLETTYMIMTKGLSEIKPEFIKYVEDKVRSEIHEIINEEVNRDFTIIEAKTETK
jgi:hypothetical protein